MASTVMVILLQVRRRTTVPLFVKYSEFYISEVFRNFIVRPAIISSEHLHWFLLVFFDRQRDSPVRDVDYEPFDSILCPNRSQKSQEISIRRSLNEVRTLRDQESCRAEFSLMRQHLS